MSGDSDERQSDGFVPAGEPVADPASRRVTDSELQALRERCFAERLHERERFVHHTILRAGVHDSRVLRAMCRVPRHRFVPQELQSSAYGDFPLPIGHGQTISQPFIVAYMLEQVRVGPSDRCLEIGTGSGYQTAVLAELTESVYSVEFHRELSVRASRVLSELGYRAHLRVGDGTQGWQDASPFDVIVVSAAPEIVPARLLEQLRVGGRLILPVGAQERPQVLELWTRQAPGTDRSAWDRRPLIHVSFVPFLGGAEQLR